MTKEIIAIKPAGITKLYDMFALKSNTNNIRSENSFYTEKSSDHVIKSESKTRLIK